MSKTAPTPSPIFTFTPGKNPSSSYTDYDFSRYHAINIDLTEKTVTFAHDNGTIHKFQWVGDTIDDAIAAQLIKTWQTVREEMYARSMKGI